MPGIFATRKLSQVREIRISLNVFSKKVLKMPLTLTGRIVSIHDVEVRDAVFVCLMTLLAKSS